MKTVRLSQDLKRIISNNARIKYMNAHPQKTYPDSGYDLLVEQDIIGKTERTSALFKQIWNMPMPTETARYVVISSAYEKEPDEDGYVESYNRQYTFDLQDTEVPSMLLKYDVIKMDVKPDHPTFVECIAIQNYNEKLDNKRGEERRALDSVMERFSTLNQLLKAAPYLKDLVPQEKVSKMHEEDDRSGRRKELAELADGELQGIRETLLESSLLGDD
tara:strand:- start:1578 stop:2231 length:654 start_codon:yes stop_codon:yes gene_type:complete